LEHTIDMKRLFFALSRTSDGSFVIDGHHRIIFWNQAAEEILGFSAKEVTGRLCYEILGGRDEQGRTLCQRYCKIAIQAERDGLLPNQDLLADTQTGKGRWLNVTTFPYPVGDKNSRRVIVHLFRDASKKKSHQMFVDQVLSASEQLQQNNGRGFITPNPARAQTGNLTLREQQVLKSLAQGSPTKEIAHELSISPLTVRNHVQNILNKLGVHSRLEAIAYSYQHGLIEIDET